MKSLPVIIHTVRLPWASKCSAELGGDCIYCMQTPGPTAAKRLFRASLLFLPLYMLGMVVHRVPQTQEHRSLQQVMTQARLNVSFKARQASEERLGAPSHGAVLTALTAAPFPFLPVPLRCPSKVACEGGPEAAEDTQKERS